MLRSCDWIVSLRPWSKNHFPPKKKMHHAMAEAMSRTFGSTRSRSLAVWAPRTFHEPRAIEGAADSGTIWDSDVVDLLPNCFSTFWLNLGWHFATRRAFLSSMTGMADEVAVTCPLVYAIVSNFFSQISQVIISLSSGLALDFHGHPIQPRFSPAFVHLCLVSYSQPHKGTSGGQRQWHVQGWLRGGRGASSGFPLHCRTTKVAGLMFSCKSMYCHSTFCLECFNLAVQNAPF